MGASGSSSPAGSLGFAADIRPLFRPKDRDAMLRMFDLWSLDDVRQHAEAIHSQIDRGTMPCDGTWPSADRDLLRRWIDEGAQP